MSDYREPSTGWVFLTKKVRSLMGDFHGGRAYALHRGAFSESPWHRVVLSPFLFANYEVGQKEWLRLMPLDCLSPIPRRGEGS